MVSDQRILNQRFRLDRELGRGGFAAVYLATDLLLSTDRLQRRVAVKILDPQLVSGAKDHNFLTRFREEASVVAALDHPNILGLHDYGEVDGTAYLVMPYIAGGTLHDRLRVGEPLALADIGAYLRQAADALDFAHQHNLVHRDVKPQNMLLRERSGHLLLADFGIAKLLSSASIQSRTGIMGTVAYMAPEQFQGQVGKETDIYALGCVLFQLLTGQVPYDGPTEQVMYGHLVGPIPSLAARNPAPLPTPMQAVIDQALAKQPHERFPSAGALVLAYELASRGDIPSHPTVVLPPASADVTATLPHLVPTRQLVPPSPPPGGDGRPTAHAGINRRTFLIGGTVLGLSTFGIGASLVSHFVANAAPGPGVAIATTTPTATVSSVSTATVSPIPTALPTAMALPTATAPVVIPTIAPPTPTQAAVPPTSTLLFDGLYVYADDRNKGHYNFLRFFSDGEVVGASVAADLSMSDLKVAVARWLVSGYENRGRIQYNPPKITFTLTSSAEIVDYTGTVGANTLRLDSHSRTTDYSATKDYTYEKL